MSASGANAGVGPGRENEQRGAYPRRHWIKQGQVCGRLGGLLQGDARRRRLRATRHTGAGTQQPDLSEAKKCHRWERPALGARTELARPVGAAARSSACQWRKAFRVWTRLRALRDVDDVFE